MSSLERIAFLQEKLQDIRNHYHSLKSEVASIDRRRKRMKKKERESESTPAVFKSQPWPLRTRPIVFLFRRHRGGVLFVIVFLLAVLQLADCGRDADAG